MNDSLGKKIREWCLRTNNRPADLVRESGISQSTISRILNNDNYNPGSDKTASILEIVGVDVDKDSEKTESKVDADALKSKIKELNKIVNHWEKVANHWMGLAEKYKKDLDELRNPQRGSGRSSKKPLDPK